MPELAAEERIAGAGVDGQAGEIHEAELRGIGRDLGMTVAVADPVDGAVHGGSAEPVKDVGVRGERVELRVQLQEDILRGLFGEEAIGEDAQRDAEDPVLVLQQESAEGLLTSVVQVKSLPSPVYTPAGARQDAEMLGGAAEGYEALGTKEYRGTCGSYPEIQRRSRRGRPEVRNAKYPK